MADTMMNKAYSRHPYAAVSAVTTLILCLSSCDRTKSWHFDLKNSGNDLLLAFAEPEFEIAIVGVPDRVGVTSGALVVSGTHATQQGYGQYGSVSFQRHYADGRLTIRIADQLITVDENARRVSVNGMQYLAAELRGMRVTVDSDGEQVVRPKAKQDTPPANGPQQ